jgi:hypothetical protein
MTEPTIKPSCKARNSDPISAIEDPVRSRNVDNEGPIIVRAKPVIAKLTKYRGVG